MVKYITCILKLHCQLVQFPQQILKTVKINYSETKNIYRHLITEHGIWKP